MFVYYKISAASHSDSKAKVALLRSTETAPNLFY